MEGIIYLICSNIPVSNSVDGQWREFADSAIALACPWRRRIPWDRGSIEYQIVVVTVGVLA